MIPLPTELSIRSREASAGEACRRGALHIPGHPLRRSTAKGILQQLLKTCQDAIALDHFRVRAASIGGIHCHKIQAEIDVWHLPQ